MILQRKRSQIFLFSIFVIFIFASHATDKLEKEENEDNEKEQCSICLTADGCLDFQWLNCSHKFHKDCVKKWEELSNKCPLCRIANGEPPKEFGFDDEEVRSRNEARAVELEHFLRWTNGYDMRARILDRMHRATFQQYFETEYQEVETEETEVETVETDTEETETEVETVETETEETETEVETEIQNFHIFPENRMIMLDRNLNPTMLPHPNLIAENPRLYKECEICNDLISSQHKMCEICTKVTNDSLEKSSATNNALDEVPRYRDLLNEHALFKPSEDHNAMYNLENSSSTSYTLGNNVLNPDEDTDRVKIDRLELVQSTNVLNPKQKREYRTENEQNQLNGSQMNDQYLKILKKPKINEMKKENRKD